MVKVTGVAKGVTNSPSSLLKRAVAIVVALAMVALGMLTASPAQAEEIAPGESTSTPSVEPSPSSAPSQDPTETPSPTSSQPGPPSGPASPAPSSSSTPDDQTAREKLGAKANSMAVGTNSGFSTTAASSSGKTAADLANDLQGKNVTISNAAGNYNTLGAGTFTGADSIIGIDEGVVLSSGKVQDLPGNKSVSSFALNTDGDPQLTAIAGMKTNDASILEFDVVPAEENLEFNYVFTSGELNYVGSFNDAVGLWINGNNCAKLPTGDAATLNNLRQIEGNKVYSITNTAFDKGIRQNVWAVPLICKVKVTPGQKVRIKIAVADALDRSLDSAIFVNKNSVVSLPSSNIELIDAPDVNGQVGSELKAKLTDDNGDPLVGKKVRFAYNGVFYEGTTDANGIATVNVPPSAKPVSGNKVGLEVSFMGDEDYSSSNLLQQLDFVVLPPPAVPAKPSAEAKTTSSITVTVPPNKTGTPPAAYKLHVDGNDKLSCTVPATDNPLSCDITGLKPGSTYQFVANAILGADVAGPSAKSEPYTLAKPNKPKKPLVDITGPGDATVTVDPADNGGTPDEYVINVYDDQGTLVDSQTVPAQPAPVTADFSGLDPDKKYNFDVEAKNDLGDSGKGPQTGPVLADVPGVPAAPKPSVTKDGEVTVEIDPPAEAGNLSYTVFAYEDGGTEPVSQCTVLATANPLSCVIKPLDNTKPYTFKSNSTNGDDTSALSPAGGPVIPAAPGPMDTPTLKITDAGEVEVSFDAPDTGGTPNEYVVTVYDKDGNPVDTKTVPGDESPLKVVFDNLAVDEPYTFEVKAENGAGNTVSDEAGPIVPDQPGKPGAYAGVDSFDSVSGTGTVTVVVTPPTDGGTINEYIVTPSNGEPPCVLAASDSPLECTFSDVDSTTTFEVKATNDAGNTDSDVAGPVVFDKPNPPTALEADVVGVGMVEIEVTPAVDGGTANEYIVTADVPGDPNPPSCTVSAAKVPLTCIIGGLNPDDNYTFTAEAVNGIDTSTPADPPVESNSVMPNVPAGPPGAPEVTIIDSPNNDTVEVVVPKSTTGGTPTEYQVFMNVDGGLFDPTPVCVIPAPVDPEDPITCEVAELEEGKTYQFFANAWNFAKSDDSVLSPVISFDEPNTPSVPDVVLTGEGEVEVTVTPTVDGGTPSEYIVYAYEGDGTGDPQPVASCTIPANANPLSCKIDVPDGDKEYVFDAEAVNGLDDSGNSAKTSPPIIPSSPKQPTIENATPSANGEVEIEVAPSSDGGAPADSYTVYAYEGTNPDPVGSCDIPGNAIELKCTISGLDPEKEYVFEAIAENGAGDSAPSTPTDPIIPSVPNAPSIENVTVTGDGEVKIEVAPATDGASADSYSVYAYEEGSSTPTGFVCDPTPIPADAADLNCSFTGLDDTKKYFFEVVAENSAGESEYSTPSDLVIPAKPGEPGKPEIEVVAEGEVEVTVTPATDGGYPTEYTIELFEEGDDVTPVDSCTIPANQVPLSCIFGHGGPSDKLDKNKKYKAKTKAENSAGPSDDSAASEEVTPDSPPTTPALTDVNVVDNGEIEGTVTPGTGGGKAKKYKIKAYKKGTDELAGECEIDADDPAPLKCAVTGLDPADDYELVAEAINDGGTSEETGKSDSMTPQAPKAPSALNPVVTAPGNVTVTPTADPDGGTPSKFIVTVEPDPVSGPMSCEIDLTKGETSCSFAGLDTTQEYQFTVVAENGIAQSPEFGQGVFPDFAPDKASQPEAEVEGSGKIKVKPKKNPSGPHATNYVVTMEPTGDTCELTDDSVPFECVFDVPDETESYEFTSEASNRSGTNGASDSSQPVVAEEPSAPAGLNAQVTGPGAVNLTVTPASGGGTPSEYVISVVGDSSKSCTVAAGTVPLACTITGLSPFESYSFEASAKNVIGSSDGVAQTPSVQPNLPPATPKAPKGSYLPSGQVSVTVPPNTSGGAVSSYVLSVAGNPALACTVTMPTNPISCVIPGLSNTKSYQFVAQAVNSLGTSAYSPRSAKLGPLTKPKTPVAPKITPVSGNKVVVTVPKVQSNVSKYVVTVAPGKKKCTINMAKKPLSCTISGLKPGISYSFTTQAFNAKGKSKVSKAKKAKTPLKPMPVPVLKAAVTKNSNKVNFSWGKPFTGGDRPVNGYRLTLKQVGKNKLLLRKNLKANQRSFSLTKDEVIALIGEQGQLRGEQVIRKQFVVEVRAVNVAGTSPIAKQFFVMVFQPVPQ